MWCFSSRTGFGWECFFSIGWAPVASLSDAMTLEGIRQQKQCDSSKYEYGAIRQWGSIGYMVGVIIVGWAVGWGIRGGALVTFLLGLYVFLIPAVQSIFHDRNGQLFEHCCKTKVLLWILFCAGLHFSVHLGSSSYIMKHAGEIGVSIGWTSIAIALGVIVEIIVFQRATWFERIAPNRLLVFACALAIPDGDLCGGGLLWGCWFWHKLCTGHFWGVLAGCGSIGQCDHTSETYPPQGRVS